MQNDNRQNRPEYVPDSVQSGVVHAHLRGVRLLRPSKLDHMRWLRVRLQRERL